MLVVRLFAIKNSASFSYTFEYKKVKANRQVILGFILRTHDEAGLDPESVCVASQVSVVIARLTGLIFSLALSKHLLFRVTGQSTAGAVHRGHLTVSACL